MVSIDQLHQAMSDKHLKIIDKLSKHYHNPASIIFRGVEVSVLQVCNVSDYFQSPALDLGCDDGYLTSVVFSQKFDIGLDNNEAGNLVTAIKKHRYKKVLIKDARKTMLKAKSLNLIFSNSVIEHIPDPHLVIREQSRILKSGGYLIFTVPNDNFTNSLIFNKILSKTIFSSIGQLYASRRNSQLNHYNLLDLENWTKILKQNDIEIKKNINYISPGLLTFWDGLAIIYRLSLFKPLKRCVRFLSLFIIKKLNFVDQVNNKNGVCTLYVCQKK